MQIYDEINNCWVSHRELAEYKMRKCMVRDAWLWGGVLMMLLPAGTVFVLALLGCFLSFMYLDEKPYKLESFSVKD